MVGRVAGKNGKMHGAKPRILDLDSSVSSLYHMKLPLLRCIKLSLGRRRTFVPLLTESGFHSCRRDAVVNDTFSLFLQATEVCRKEGLRIWVRASAKGITILGSYYDEEGA